MVSRKVTIPLAVLLLVGAPPTAVPQCAPVASGDWSAAVAAVVAQSVRSSAPTADARRGVEILDTVPADSARSLVVAVASSRQGVRGTHDVVLAGQDSACYVYGTSVEWGVRLDRQASIHWNDALTRVGSHFTVPDSTAALQLAYAVLVAATGMTWDATGETVVPVASGWQVRGMLAPGGGRFFVRVTDDGRVGSVSLPDQPSPP